MKNFTDLMIDIAKDGDLAEACLNKIQSCDATELSSWLDKKDYSVDETDCKKIIDNKDHISSANAGVY